MAKKGEVLDGRYEILALVGKGYFSQIWLALDKHLNKPWAIKEFAEHRGSRQTDARSDIFTLGMTMHHLITGVDPRPADYRYAPIRQWNSKLSKSMEAIIDKCTAVRPEDRYQNCKELRYDLEQEIVKRKKGKKVSFFR